jgi:hypothetical protein
MSMRLPLAILILSVGCTTDKGPSPLQLQSMEDPPAWLRDALEPPDGSTNRPSAAALAAERASVQQKRDVLIHQVDHVAILKDLRWIMANRGHIPSPFMMPKEGGTGPIQWIRYVHPQEARLPERIRKLDARVVVVDQDFAAVDCGTRDCRLLLFGFRQGSGAEADWVRTDEGAEWTKITDGLWVELECQTDETRREAEE